MSSEFVKFFHGQGIHLLKFNYPIDLINLATILLVKNLNKCSSICN